jgi:hypothetical protein
MGGNSIPPPGGYIGGKLPGMAPVGATKSSSLDALFGGASLLGSGADLATIVFALQIQQMDKSIETEIKRIEDAGKVREAINGRMQALRELRDLIRGIDAEYKDGHVKTLHVVEHMIAKGMSPDLLKQMDFELQADGTLKTTTGKLLIGAESALDANGQFKNPAISHHPLAYLLPPELVITGVIQPEVVDSEIKRLESEAQKLDQNREIKMIMLNQELNKKEQAVTQLTNIIKKTHDTKSAVIANLK